MSLKKIKYYLNKYERVISFICQIFLGVIILLRLAIAYRTAIFVDARFFVETANWVRQGISPYKPEVFLTKFGCAPIQPPSMSLLAMPLCIFSKTIQNYVFFCLGVISFFVFVIMVFHYYGYNFKDYIKPRWNNLPINIIFTCVCISSPFLVMLRAGQTSSMAAFFLFVTLLYPKQDTGGNILWLGLSAALKYSLMTFQVPVLVLQRRWKMSILAFLVFVMMCLSIGYWLPDIVSVFKEYIVCVTKSTSAGGNSFGEGAFFFLGTGFFKNGIINRFLQIIVCISYCLVLFKIWKRCNSQSDSFFPSKLTAWEWGLFTAMTVFISYHRIQDGILFMPFLGVVVLDLYKKCINNIRKINMINLIVSCMMLLFWVAPLSLVLTVCSKIGEIFPSGEKIFYYTKDEVGGFSHMFPLLPCIMLAMICLMLWLEFSQTIEVEAKQEG